MNYLFFIAIIVFIFFNPSNQMNFYFYLETKGIMKCFGEYLIENSTSKLSINSEQTNYNIRVFDPNGNIIFTKEKQKEIKLNLISSETGIFQFCLTNFSKEPVELKLTMLTGIAAKDYSSLIKVSKIQPLELFLIKLLDSVEFLIREVGIVFSNEIHFKSTLHESISSVIIYYSGIMLGIILLINIIEYFVIKGFINYRKTV